MLKSVHARPVRIMIVDDSPVFCNYWSRMLEREKIFKIVGTAFNGQQAVEQLGSLEPDLMLLDLEMPIMDGLTAIPILLEKRPDLKIIVASVHTVKGSAKTIEALTVGAADCLAKVRPSDTQMDVRSIRIDLIEKIKSLFPYANEESSSEIKRIIPKVSLKEAGATSGFEALAIGCSTGGPKALDIFFKNLSPSVLQPIFITQHMPKFFITALAERLTLDTGRLCVEPRDGEQVENGKIYLAPGDVHMLVIRKGAQEFIRLSDAAPERFCRPAVDPMFRSLAEAYGPKVLSVVLTGMGEDGMRGASEIVKAGGRVLVQDEFSSVVWGMPGAVANAGLASEILPIELIGLRVSALLGASSIYKESA